MHRRTLWTAVMVAGLLLAACGGDQATSGASGADTTPQQTATAAPASPTVPAEATTPAEVATSEDAPTGGGASPMATDSSGAAAAGETVAIADTDLGSVLVDGEDRTLYLFLPDEQGESTCYNGCAQNWPPLEGEAQAGDGVDETLLGTVERDNGTLQATYGGWPLYYFAGDSAAGDLNGQGVGDVWYVVDPAGEPVGADATAAATGTSTGSGDDEDY